MPVSEKTLEAMGHLAQRSMTQAYDREALKIVDYFAHGAALRAASASGISFNLWPRVKPWWRFW